jgi:Protein of unknown function (DUF2884)
MRSTPLLFAAALLCSSPLLAVETDINVSCEVQSPYQVSMNGQAFVFENNAGRNTRLVLGGGKLFINGKQTTLSAEDQPRIDAFEAELRLLVPEARKVVSEAVIIAFDALSEVSIALSGDESKRPEYDKARIKALASLNDANIMPFFEDGSIDAIVDPLVAEFVPDITRSALGFAMKSMFAGEQKNKETEARMQAMENSLDARVEARAEALQPLSQSLCKRIQRMESLDSALQVRLPDGKPINFLDNTTAR